LANTRRAIKLSSWRKVSCSSVIATFTLAMGWSPI